jgi:hypothetical protein
LWVLLFSTKYINSLVMALLLTFCICLWDGTSFCQTYVSILKYILM